jgi:aspartate dehydrogenase
MPNMKKRKMRIGVVGCGAIGSRIAKSVQKDLKKYCELSGIYDIDEDKSFNLVKELGVMDCLKTSLEDLIKDCDLIVESVNAKDTRHIVKSALRAKKNVLAMSVGKLLNAHDLFNLAKKNHCHILLPSGAIAGVDAIKAASLANIDHITLTTRKPPSGFRNNPYFAKKKIDISRIKKETVLFDGDVDTAVELFPQNINVAATVSLACQSKSKMRIRIMTSPHYKRNSHEIEMSGEFGSMITKTDNVVCPDNPKTSYLAVLSGLQTLKQFCTGILIGT